MNFSEQLIYLIDEFAKRIGIVIDWTNDSVMPYLQDLVGRYITYEITMNEIGIGLGVIVAITSIICGLSSIKKYREDKYDEFCLCLFFLALFGVFTAFVIIVPNLIGLLKLINIPEFYIYKQLMNVQYIYNQER